MIIPLQSDDGNKQQSESAAGDRATASSPVNEDGNVSSEPELAADSSGEEGQGNNCTMHFLVSTALSSC